jgi:hypothetical protein
VHFILCICRLSLLFPSVQAKKKAKEEILKLILFLFRRSFFLSTNEKYCQIITTTKKRNLNFCLVKRKKIKDENKNKQKEATIIHMHLFKRSVKMESKCKTLSISSTKWIKTIKWIMLLGLLFGI